MIVVVVMVLAWCVGACPRCRVSGVSAQCSGGGGDDVLCGSVSLVLGLGPGGIGSMQWWWCSGMWGRVLGVGGVWGRVLGVGFRGGRLNAVVVVVMVWWCVGACPRCRSPGSSPRCSDGGGRGVVLGGVSSV
jgi:hypothetical protein